MQVKVQVTQWPMSVDILMMSWHLENQDTLTKLFLKFFTSLLYVSFKAFADALLEYQRLK